MQQRGGAGYLSLTGQGDVDTKHKRIAAVIAATIHLPSLSITNQRHQPQQQDSSDIGAGYETDIKGAGGPKPKGGAKKAAAGTARVKKAKAAGGAASPFGGLFGGK